MRRHLFACMGQPNHPRREEIEWVRQSPEHRSTGHIWCILEHRLLIVAVALFFTFILWSETKPRSFTLNNDDLQIHEVRI